MNKFSSSSSSSTTTTITAPKPSYKTSLSNVTKIKQIITNDTPALDKSCHIVIHNKLYDISDFIPIHPGGQIIKSYLGKDGTDVFEAFHASSTWETLANYYVCDYPTSADDELSKRLRALNGTFKNQGYYTTNARFYVTQFGIGQAILATSVVLLWHQYVITSAMLLGLFWQQSGWLSHDLLHYSVFESRTINNVLAMLVGGVFQGFSTSWWKNKHNAHHAQPNIVEFDPDIDTMPIIAWSKQNLDRFNRASRLADVLITYQSKLYFVILTFARTSWCLQSLMHVPQSTLEFSSLLVHWVWFFGLMAALIDGMALRVVFFVVSQATCGLLLALVFSLNHNGMNVFSDADQDHGFFMKQILTSRDIRSSMFMDWFCGGLNFQIEHHLFPQMPRHSYRNAQVHITQLCDELGIHHHETGFWHGIREVLDRLYHVSKLYVAL